MVFQLNFFLWNLDLAKAKIFAKSKIADKRLIIKKLNGKIVFRLLPFFNGKYMPLK